jgi:hypothetical protein
MSKKIIYFFQQCFINQVIFVFRSKLKSALNFERSQTANDKAEIESLKENIRLYSEEKYSSKGAQIILCFDFFQKTG